MARPDTFDSSKLRTSLQAVLDREKGWGFAPSVTESTRVFAPPSETAPDSLPPAHYGFDPDGGELLTRVYEAIGEKLVGPEVLAFPSGIDPVDRRLSRFGAIYARFALALNNSVASCVWSIVSNALGSSYVPTDDTPDWDGDSGLFDFVARTVNGLRLYFEGIEEVEVSVTNNEESEITVDPAVVAKLREADTCADLRDIFISSVVKPVVNEDSE